MTEHQVHNIVVTREKIDAATSNLASKTLSGDIADALLDEIKKNQKPWNICTQEEQEELVDRLREFVKPLVESAIRTISANGRVVMELEVKEVTVKNGLKVIMGCSKTQEALVELGMAEGCNALVILENQSQYIGERCPSADLTESDQMTLIAG